MTEAEWLTTKMPLYMLREYPAKWDVRKVRLFWCACVRRVWRLVTDELVRRLMGLVENFPDDVEGSLRPEIEAVRRRLASNHFGEPWHPDNIPYHPDYWTLGVFAHSPPDPLLALARREVEHAIDDAVRARGPTWGWRTDSSCVRTPRPRRRRGSAGCSARFSATRSVSLTFPRG